MSKEIKKKKKRRKSRSLERKKKRSFIASCEALNIISKHELWSRSNNLSFWKKNSTDHAGLYAVSSFGTPKRKLYVKKNVKTT